MRMPSVLDRPLSRMPLRVKLVAAVLALVTFALTVIGTASAFFLHRYLIERMDSQLQNSATTADYLQMARQGNKLLLTTETDYYVRITDLFGSGAFAWHSPGLSDADLPDKLPTGPDALQKHLNEPFTARSANRQLSWRVLVTQRPDGSILYLAANLANTNGEVDRLVTIELIVGGSVLATLALVGAGAVRQSLKPLRAIEHTAAAIAGGDLTRRVPESDPETEVGSLARSLNAMLAQIEAAFTAREHSERAARAAESTARAAASAAREAAAAARASEARARRSEERMRQFIADASHELRTPLTTIRGFAELYRQGAARDPEQVAGVLRRIEDEAARMGLLVEDLLLLARLDQERPLAFAPVELRVIATDAVAAARAVAPDRDVTLEIAPGTGPLVVSADEGRLRQVVGNLMTNALTHTPAGTPVALRLRAADRTAVLEVADRGPGLTPEQAEHVFERFYRVDKARTRRAAISQPVGGPLGAGHGAGHSGAGLGLAIVSALVSAHEGKVEVTSTPGEGSVFRVCLPLPEPTGREESGGTREDPDAGRGAEPVVP